MDEFATMVGAVASAIAIASAILAVIVWRQQRQVRGELGTVAHKLLRLDRRWWHCQSNSTTY